MEFTPIKQQIYLIFSNDLESSDLLKIIDQCAAIEMLSKRCNRMLARLKDYWLSIIKMLYFVAKKEESTYNWRVLWGSCGGTYYTSFNYSSSSSAICASIIVAQMKKKKTRRRQKWQYIYWRWWTRWWWGMNGWTLITVLLIDGWIKSPTRKRRSAFFFLEKSYKYLDLPLPHCSLCIFFFCC